MLQIEYVWLDGKNSIRSKTKIIRYDEGVPNLSDIPDWNYDGSSTYQAFTEVSEIILYPIQIYPNPFVRNGKGYIVLCKTSDPECSVTKAQEIFNNNNDKPLFGLEQEFFIIDTRTGNPLGWPINGEPKAQGDYYCSVGSNVAYGRDYLDECMERLLDIGINITGMNYEVAPGQAEFQVCDYGIEASNGLIILRYVLARVGERYKYAINYNPKPIEGNWNGSGCHVNFSTTPMREEGGIDIIYECMEKLSLSHSDDIKLYGIGNEKRLTGIHETSSMESFSYGVANRAASVRIPTQTLNDGYGYFEDRRPGANIDPYVVTSNLYKICTK